MCGIYGCLEFERRPDDQAALMRRMGASIVHRGPDDEGSYVRNGVALGMRRLSIIDLAGGQQPISNEDGTIWVVCNGEIYNFRELRNDLQQRGHQFRTKSDTEVIVHLYEQEGPECVRRMRGMFAFAIWDEKRDRLLLARDRLGKKPLYIRKERDRVLFASEIKCILESENVPRRINPEALSEYLALGYVAAPATIFEGIEKLLPGHYLQIEAGEFQQRQYWDVSFAQIEHRSENEWIELVRNKLEEAVRVRLVSDVPLGAFLSGGIDSSAIVALMSRVTGEPVKTYSIGFEGEDRFYNELPYAGIVARAFKTDHHEIIVRPAVAELFSKLVWHLDEPIADSAFVTTFLVAELARESVTVILSGVGGDELFGGYNRYLGDNLARYYNLLPGAVRHKLIPALLHRLPQDRSSRWKNNLRYAAAFADSANLSPTERYMSYTTVFSPELRHRLLGQESNGEREPASAVMEEYFAHCAAADSLNGNIYVDMKTSLADDLLALTDKMTMAASIECRAPFIDHELVELTSRMPANLKVRGMTMKYLLKKVVQPWLPAEILHRKKRGFGAPVGAWLRRDLEPLTREMLSEESVRQRGLFDPAVVQEIIDRHARFRSDNTDQILALIMLEVWCRTFLDAKPQPTGGMATILTGSGN